MNWKYYTDDINTYILCCIQKYVLCLNDNVHYCLVFYLLVTITKKKKLNSSYKSFQYEPDYMYLLASIWMCYTYNVFILILFITFLFKACNKNKLQINVIK